MGSLAVTGDLLNGAGDLAATMTWAHTVATLVARRGRDVACAMHGPVTMPRLGHAVAFVSLAFAVSGCDFNPSFGDFKFDFSPPCPPVGTAPPNSTTSTDSGGCKYWRCNEGFFACGRSADCAFDLLHDSRNCGACFNDCGAGACVEGVCGTASVVATGIASEGLALDATSAYVVDAGLHWLLRVPKSGGAQFPVAPLQSPGGEAGFALGADASGVYWIDAGTLYVVRSGSVRRVPLANGFDFAQPPLRFDDAGIYFEMVLPPDGGFSGPFDPAVWRVPKSGGAARIAVSLSVIDLDGYDSTLALAPPRMAVANGTSLSLGPIDGDATAVVAKVPTGVASLAADGQRVYFTVGVSALQTFEICTDSDAACPRPAPVSGSNSGFGLFAVPWDGGAAQMLSGTDTLVNVHVGHGAIWGITPYGSQYLNAIMRVDLATGLSTMFAGGGLITDLAIDGSALYWTRDDKLLSAPL